MTSPQAAAPAPATTGSRATRVLGGLTLAGLALLLAYALVWSPADREMQDSVRLMYVHVPTAILAYTGCAHHHARLGHVAPARSEGWWVLGGAAAEIATVFTALALVTGSIWGRPTWAPTGSGTRASPPPPCCFIMLIGVQALRRIDNESRRRRQPGACAAPSSGCCSSRTS